ncbi:SRPBCC domain-containing protein [Planctomonas sp. JC2975]|uniref:SRPBCC domain-containing protein n=1 Tax=Planctomonas sp. JC2975 TaxID=2729626 RepID=UPI0014751AF3|nr:SRPBCC domain-containing protein [Planctomonas sp. JC2975]
MTVISTARDAENLTLTFVAEFDAPPERVWQVWEDPRQLELWWGPPTWPATFDAHDLTPGGSSAYYMTGPNGEKAHGWWRTVAIDPPRRLEFDDGFSDENAVPDDGMPVTRTEVTLEPTSDGTRMTSVSRFASIEQLEQLVQMGMQEGMLQALGQIDAILADGAVAS